MVWNFEQGRGLVNTSFAIECLHREPTFSRRAYSRVIELLEPYFSGPGTESYR